MKKTQLTIIFVFFQYILFSQTGQLFVNNYPPYKYKGEGQIWSITQDNRGVMYFGGNMYIYEFDGVSWTKIQLKNQIQAIRSMGVDSKGRLYIGAVGEMGYLEPNSNGQLEYVSIVDEVDSAHKEFTDLWTIAVVDEVVYFCSGEYLFRYNPNAEQKMITISDSLDYFLMYQVNDEVFVSTRRKGMFKVDGDTLKSLPFSDRLFPWIVLPYAKDKYLIVSDGLWVYDPYNPDTNKIITKDYFDPVELKKTEKLMQKSQIYIGATYLNNGTYALSSIKNGVIVIDEKAKLLNIINKESGLNTNTVHYLYLDNNRQLWGATAYGITNIEINSPFQFFDDKNGIDGSIYCTFRRKNILYSSSNLGLYYWENGKFNGIPQLTGENSAQVFPPVALKIPGKNETITVLYSIYGMIKLDNKKVKLINNIYPISILQSRYDSSKVYLVEDYSLYTSSLNDDLTNPELIHKFDYMPLVVGEYDQNNLWLLNEIKPELYNIKTNEINSFDNNDEIQDVEFYDGDYLFGQQVFFTNKGFYVYDKKEKKFKQSENPILSSFNDIEISIFKKINDSLNFASYKLNEKNHLALVRNRNDIVVKDTFPFERLPGYEDFYIDGDSIVWIISSSAMYKFDLNYKRNYNVQNNVLIRKIIASDSVIFEGAFYDKKENRKYLSAFQQDDFEFVIDFAHNDLRFEYALPSYDNLSANMYSYSLSGRKKMKWSDWSNITFKDLSNLPEGKYIFKVRAKNVYGYESDVTEVSFRILPPWYKTIFAYIVYFLILVAIVWIVVKINSYRLKKENEHLEQIVKLRTAEINQQNEEIKTQADHLVEVNGQLIEKNEEIKIQNEEITAIAETLKDVNAKIREKNAYITDSINYAKRIQDAILPSYEFISQYLPQHFILFKPKDIISGDFYWIKKIKNYLLIAVADGTGHGVPGGLIAMLGTSILNETVRQEHISKPSEVLEFMRKTIKLVLKQSYSADSLDEGMDLGLIDINLDSSELTFSGANIPLVIIRSGKIIEFKAVFSPIGIYPFEKPFLNESITLQKNDMIYLTTDGFKDQLNNDKQKFSSKRLKEELLEIAHLHINEQKQKLLETLMLWCQDKEQTDDISLFGIKWV